ncbi:hypothetical protein ACFSVM_04315 [Paenibacillus shunpengii]|uniref:Uncharacterized protein n=1 Tax=Paenibacillus shunpengii TaxID=2054424 RepID=A0ABW5SLL8_9BACL|nr:hypothetical protein [Paenibacillus sp. PDC88]SDW33892.1 hypothetical protein SAMN05518848_1011058 [Paenibacillus sp. PDC88]
MTVLLSLSFYLIPVLGIFFVITLLEAMKKIVMNQSYKWEGTCCALCFGLIVWTIAAQIHNLF